MKSKSATLIKVIHQLLDTKDSEEIQNLLDRIHGLNAQLTFSQRKGVYDTALREAREQALHDAQAHTLNDKARAILDELKGMRGKVYTLVPVPCEKAELLRDRLQEYVQRLAQEENPLMVHQIIQATVRWLDDLPDKNLRSLGYHMLRENLESRILGAAMRQAEQPRSLSLFTELNFSRIPTLALSTLRYSAEDCSYWRAETDELAKAKDLPEFVRGVEVYGDIVRFATASEAGEYAAMVREGIALRLIQWIKDTEMEDRNSEIAVCTSSLIKACMHRPRMSNQPLPTRRVANVIYTTLSLATEDDEEMFLSTMEDQSARLDMCPILYESLRNLTLSTLVHRLYQKLEEVGAVMPPVIECLFRLFLVLSLSDSALADDKIFCWVLGVQA